MSAFEFFFSFYGLVLGLSVAVLATGAARAFKHRRTVKVGWLTLLLAIFVALDIATFWDAAWTNFRGLPFSYGLLVGGLVVAVIYFIAASLVFPEAEDDATSMDAHFWAQRRTVLWLLILANLLGGAAQLAVNLTRENGAELFLRYSLNLGLYVVLIGLAAWSRRRAIIAAALGLHTAVYLALAVASVTHPSAPDSAIGAARAETP